MNEFSENAPEIILNRKDRRALQRTGRKFPIKKKKQMEFVQLYTSDTLLGLEKEDVDFYSSEVDSINQAIKLYGAGLRLFQALVNIGVRDDTIRTHILNSAREDYNPSSFGMAIAAEADRSKFVKSENVLNVLQKELVGSKMFILEDYELYVRMLQDRTIPVVNIYREITSSLIETAELLKLEIDWLLDRERKKTQSQEIPPEEDELVVQVESEERIPYSRDKEPFLLSSWDLYWTNRHWSMEENQLVRIPTGSREESIESTRNVTLGEVMIKPGSIIRALEFHLQKDIIQRAMSSRLRHVPDYVKEWIKIKRGRDRILLAVPEEGRAIFFAGNRDVIYRNL